MLIILILYCNSATFIDFGHQSAISSTINLVHKKIQILFSGMLVRIFTTSSMAGGCNMDIY